MGGAVYDERRAALHPGGTLTDTDIRDNTVAQRQEEDDRAFDDDERAGGDACAAGVREDLERARLQSAAARDAAAVEVQQPAEWL